MAKRSPQAVDAARSEKIGEQQESITVDLDDAEVERERALVMDLLGRKANLEQARVSMNADYKAKITRVQKDIDEAVKAATTRKKTLDVLVEDRLRGAQVFSVRADTGEVIRQRAATSGERQESMFVDGKAADRFAGDAFGDAT